MASLREWIALTLSALLFSVVAGYGVGRALNAKNEAPAPRPALSAVAIVDRTGEPTAPIGALSASEMEMPSVVASAPVEPPTALPPPPVMTQAPTPISTQPAATAPAAVLPTPPAPAPAVATQAPPVPVLPVAAGERPSVLISFADQRLYLMAGERVLASYRVKFGFDPARVKPGETKIQAKAAGKHLELGWKSFPVTAGGERGFILSPADFDAIAARLPVGAQVATTRERVGAQGAPQPSTASGSSSARVSPASSPNQPPQAPVNESPAIDAEQPAFLAAAPRMR